MPNFMVRTSCEYSVVVQAKDSEEAISIADKANKWSTSMSPIEAEQTDEQHADITSSDIQSPEQLYLWSVTIWEANDSDKMELLVVGETKEVAIDVAMSEYKEIYLPIGEFEVLDVYSLGDFRGPKGNYKVTLQLNS